MIIFYLRWDTPFTSSTDLRVAESNLPSLSSLKEGEMNSHDFTTSFTVALGMSYHYGYASHNVDIS